MSTLAERLAAKTQRQPNGCLRFTGCHNSRGYGCIGVDGKVELAHRVAYTLHVGPIPAGLQIDHVAARGCQHKDCVEPSHLEPVTQDENMARTAKATKTHCVHGHPLSGDNLRVKKRPNGRTLRNCRTCDNAGQRARAWARRYMDRPLTPAEFADWIAHETCRESVVALPIHVPAQEAATAQGGAVA